jgi:hypothetical protein
MIKIRLSKSQVGESEKEALARVINDSYLGMDSLLSFGF